MEKSRLAYRMYVFVNNKLSNMQIAIQLARLACNYVIKYKDNSELQNFVFWDKQWVILDGGSSNDEHTGRQKGTMEELYDKIRQAGIPHDITRDQDVNSALTAICFLADERVWNSTNYASFVNYVIVNTEANVQEEIMIRMLSEDDLISKFSTLYKSWLELMGGKKNLFLRELIKDQKVLLID